MASADTLSPVYPDRPIRPMPKNRLRSRLSPEQTASLIYPPDPPISSLSFNFPFGAGDKSDGRAVNGHGHGHHYAEQVTHCTCGADHADESEEEEIVYDHPNFRVQSPVEGLQQRRMMESQRASGKPPPPASIASSADGYESFENTSNKKKRKIPLSGSVHQAGLTTDLAKMGISSSHGTDGANDDAPTYHQNGYQPAPGMGHAGAGRGRTPKPSPMRRRDMRSSMSSSHTNGYPASIEQTVERGGAYKGDGTKITQQPTHEHKIISNAIANAQSQPATPQKGKENVSLLSQSSPKSTTPKTQFTFTCESDSSNKMVWPGQPPNVPYASPTPAGHYTPVWTNGRPIHPQTSQPTQTAPQMRGGSTATSMPQPPPHHPQTAQHGPPPPSQQANAGATAPPKKPRPRRPSREYAIAARQRRLQQEYTNYHHKPTKDNMWICEFCEYEDLFGTPPLALIRQYEIKDRAERKKADEKRRLLEKAKLKGRKGRKGGKNKGQGAQQQQQQGAQQNGSPGVAGAQGQEQHYQDGTQVNGEQGQEEYYDDEYDDGYDPVSPDEHPHEDDSGGGADTGQTHVNNNYVHSHSPPLPHKPHVAEQGQVEQQAVAGASA